MKHRKGAGGLDEVGEVAATGGGIQPGIRPVIQGSGTGSINVRVGVMGDVRRDDEGGGGQPQEVPTSYHGISSGAEGR